MLIIVVIMCVYMCLVSATLYYFRLLVQRHGSGFRQSLDALVSLCFPVYLPSHL